MRWPGVPGAGLGILALAACCAAPAAGVRLQGQQQQQPEARDFVFYAAGEEPEALPLRKKTKMRRPRRDESRGDESPLTRVIIASRWSCGFDDSYSRILRLMELAQVANAKLVLPPPRWVLEKKHGNKSYVAEWWDEYFDAAPRFYRREDYPRCHKRLINETEFKASIRLGNASVFFNHSMPLCVHLEGDYAYKTMASQPEVMERAKALKDRGSQPLLWVSKKIADYTEGVLREIGPSFSAVHVREGDMGSPECTRPPYVAEQMTKFGRADRWLVCSNANETWYDELENATRGLNVITEHQLPSLTSIKDNFFRYGVEKCVFGEADHLLDTYRNVGFRCKQVAKSSHKFGLLCAE